VTGLFLEDINGDGKVCVPAYAWALAACLCDPSVGHPLWLMELSS
jgi:hypothetical protein